jgi:hypothetical protein
MEVGGTFQESIRAAYALAWRMTGSHDAAAEAVVRAARVGGLETAPLVHAVRAEAKALRGRPVEVGVARPDAFHGVAVGDWEIVERVALRGMSVSEAAADARVSRADAMMRLQRGMRAARACIDDRHAPRHAEAASTRALGEDRTAGRLHDPACDREPEAASLPGLPG